MSRVFTTGDSITFDAGGAANLATAAFTWAALWKPASNHIGMLFNGIDGSAVSQVSVNPINDNNVYINLNGFTSTPYDSYIGDWGIVGFTKAAGSAVVRAHTYTALGGWVHTDLTSKNAKAAIATIVVGPFDGSNGLRAKLAVQGFWSGTALDDADFEDGTGFETSLANWVNKIPSVLWAFNQASTSDPVTDLMGSGADQTALTGTTVDGADDPPGFSYTLGPVIPLDTRLKVNRHVTYLLSATVAGVANQIKLRPATITEIAADGWPVLRVGRHSEVYGDSTNGVQPRTAATDTGVYTWI